MDKNLTAKDLQFLKVVDSRSEAKSLESLMLAIKNSETHLSTKIDTVSNQMHDMSSKVAYHGREIINLDKSIKSQASQISSISSKIVSVETKTEGIKSKIRNFEDEVDSMKIRLNYVEQKQYDLEELIASLPNAKENSADIMKRIIKLLNESMEN